MKKKYISLFLALVMIIGLAVPTTLASSTLYDNLMATHDVADFMGVYQTAATADLQALTTEDITDVVNHLKGIYEDAPAMIANRDAMVSELLHLPNAPEQCSECGTLGGHTGGCSLTPTPAPTQEPTPTPEASEPTPTPEVDVTPEPEKVCDCTPIHEYFCELGAADPEACVCTPVHAATCPLYVVPAPTAYETLLASATIQELFDGMMADTAAVYALSYDELLALAARADQIYAAIETPTADDDEYYELVKDTCLALAICPDCELEAGEHSEDCPRLHIATMAGTLPSSGYISGEYILTANTTLTGPLYVAAETSATIDLNGYVLKGANNYSYGNDSIITNFAGATLTIKDSAPTRKHYGNLVNMTLYGSRSQPSCPYWQYVGDNSTDGSAVIYGGIITGGHTNYGGAIKNGGTLNIEGGTFAGNIASTGGSLANTVGSGGAVYSDGTVTMTGGRMCYNLARIDGGAIRTAGAGTFSMYSGMIDHNMTTGSGGGVNIMGNSTSTATFNLGHSSWASTYEASPSTIPVISNNEVYDNIYTGNGGGVHLQQGRFNFYAGSLKNNTAYNWGGGIYVYIGGDLVMESKYCSIDGNKAATGGGIALQYGEIVINGGSISNNSINTSDAASKGGTGAGIHVRVADFTMNGGVVSGNKTAYASGGAIYASALNSYETHGDPGYLGCKVTITGGEFVNNESAVDGGGIYIDKSNSTTDCVVDISGGKFSNNTANRNGGGLYMNGGTLTISQESEKTTEVNGNTATGNGGAAYVNKGSVTISGGTVGAEEAGNKAANGGAIYINDGSMTINGGITSHNEATANGGAACIAGGSLTITDGTITANKAVNGGGMYVNGPVTMTGGNITNNTATTNGGGVAIDGGGFTMISGTMTGNKATGTASLGGGAYTKGGSVIIGVQNCSGAGENHSVTHTGLTHPKVSGNNAGFGGGGLAAEGGDVTLYCGTVNNNTALSKGTGHNVFMNSGSQGELTHHLDSTTVGQETDHDIVQIGGKLNVVSSELGNTLIDVNYYSNYITIENPNGDKWPAETPKGYWVNLPYCPPEWEAYQNTNGLTFVGWTTTPSDPIGDCSGVRDKGDYKFIGDPVEIKEGLQFYAVWAPITNTLTFDSALLNYSTEGPYIASSIPTDLASYVDGDALTGVSTNSAYTYSALSAPGDLVLNKPSVPGYDFLGWVLKADTTVISNWNSDNTTTHPSSVYLLSATGAQTDNAGNSWNYDSNGKLTIDMNYNFGHLTFVGLFKEQPVTFTYEAVGPEGKSYGSLAPHATGDVFNYTETFGAATGTATPITASPAYGYKFEGWHTDEECTTDVGAALLSGEGEYKPTIQPKKNADGIYESGAFYALFDCHLADLYITKTATGAHADDQVYIFKVYEVVPGSGTTTTDKYLTSITIHNGLTTVINDLKIGTTYKVVEDIAWSWRHDPDAQSKTIEIVPNAEDPDINILSFTNTQNRDDWLTADDSVLNFFGMADT